MLNCCRCIARTVAALGLCLLAGAAAAAEPVTLRVKVFAGAQNLPIYAALAKGVFDKHGVKVNLQFTGNSTEMRNGLAAGEFEIAHSGVDNAVAMVDAAGKDAVIVMGGDSSMNDFLVQPEIKSVADLRGRILVLDAPNTGYAQLAKKLLLNHGLRDGQDYTVKPVGGSAQRLKAVLDSKENTAVVLNVPWSILAMRNGMKSMGRTIDLLGPYQATGAYVMRAWAVQNGPALERYIAAYVESLRWAMQPSNRGECVALLVKWLKIPQDVAEQTYDLLREPKFGLTTDAKFDLEGFKNVLALRAEIEGQWGGKPPAPDRYFDMGYYERAMKTLGR
jgi:NitT/TauT family transport system substrate-binding protein